MKRKNSKRGQKVCRWQSILALLMVSVMFLGACGQKNETGAADSNLLTSEAEVQTEESSDSTSGTTKEVDKSIYMDPSQDVETRVKALLEQMTLEEKVAQMMLPGQAALAASDVTDYGIGAALSGGGEAPATGNNPENWQGRVNELKQAALDSRLGIPLLYGVDAVHGHNNIFGTTIFPHNIALGAAADEALVEAIGEAAAEEVRATGIQWDFAPTLGNALNERWGRTYECFSEDYDLVARMGAAYIRGYQGERGTDAYLNDSHVLATAKHFIGEGYFTDGDDQGNVDMTAEDFDALLDSGVINPYTAALDEGVRIVMTMYGSVGGLKTHENKHLVQDLLKDELGFTGFVVSDYNAVQQNSGLTYKEQVTQAVNAGIDMIMDSDSWENVYDSILAAVEEGAISEERIDDAVTRILRVKFEAGLFEEKIGGETEQALLETIGSDEHRAIARQAVRESLVLLKNDKVGDVDALTALRNATDIQMSGQKAYDLGSQCGGWTISWQGMQGNITRGTTIIQGISDATKENGTGLSHDVTGELADGKDALIAVFGEVPYAEMKGDRSVDALTVSAKDKELLDNLRTALEGKDDIPKVAIIIAGRPLDIDEYFDMFDAVIMAWLPGTEGEGIADVLFGEYDFTGVLPYTWMKDAEDIYLKKDAALAGEEVDGEKVLFPIGYGLNKAGEQIAR